MCYTNTRNTLEKSGLLPLQVVTWEATTRMFLFEAALSRCPWEGMLVPRGLPLQQSGVPLGISPHSYMTWGSGEEWREECKENI